MISCKGLVDTSDAVVITVKMSVKVHIGMGRTSLEPILPVKWPITIETMLNFDDDNVGVRTCKQTLKYFAVNILF